MLLDVRPVVYRRRLPELAEHFPLPFIRKVGKLCGRYWPVVEPIDARKLLIQRAPGQPLARVMPVLIDSIFSRAWATQT